jgi:hypothetical protein
VYTTKYRYLYKLFCWCMICKKRASHWDHADQKKNIITQTMTTRESNLFYITTYSLCTQRNIGIYTNFFVYAWSARSVQAIEITLIEKTIYNYTNYDCSWIFVDEFLLIFGDAGSARSVQAIEITLIEDGEVMKVSMYISIFIRTYSWDYYCWDYFYQWSIHARISADSNPNNYHW